MKSILKKVAGLALSAALVFGMISCSSEAENNAALIGILNSSKGNSGTPVKETVAQKVQRFITQHTELNQQRQAQNIKLQSALQKP